MVSAIVCRRPDQCDWSIGPPAIETPTALDRLGVDMAGDRADGQRLRECEICGESVPAAVYREHLLKECPGGDE